MEKVQGYGELYWGHSRAYSLSCKHGYEIPRIAKNILLHKLPKPPN